ncbi:MAG: DUF126 domain-containing protein [Candidatus Onthovivens sp.]|nr:DUF126 domain-containing protein [Mollicutes bacterium]MDY4857978.1 DUF126 domain-containing protein [Candidatus Onthovivens sp.]
MKKFKGRVIAKGNFVGEAVVTHQGFNTLASCQKSALMNKKNINVSDQNNAEIYNLDITNKILCLPITIGSTTGGLIIQTICDMKINPRAFLFSETIDSLAASGIVLAKVWQDSNIICIDQLGEEFLNSVHTNDQVEIKEDGTVIIL